MEPILALEWCPGRRVFLGFIGVAFAAVLFIAALWSSPVYADTAHCGTINVDETWSSAGNTHNVNCDVTVAPGVTLTVTQGTLVKFASAKKLTVNGTLVALGTVGEPITMTAKTATPSAGYWQGLYFESGSSIRLEHVTVEYAGAYDFNSPYYTAVESHSPDVSISHSTFRQTSGTAVFATTSFALTNSLVTANSGYPVRIPLGAVSSSLVASNTFTGNSSDAFLVSAGTLTGSHVWPTWLSEYPVHIDYLTVAGGADLTISPGATLNFAATKAFKVDGTLTAHGTASQPIVFTARSAAPSAGFWQGLYFSSGSAGDLDYVTVEYAGDYDFVAPYNNCVEIASSDVSLSHATIRYCDDTIGTATGIYASGDLTIDSSTVSGCAGYGVQAGAAITLTNSTISGNGSYPLRISAAAIGASLFTGTTFAGNSPDAISAAGATLAGNNVWPSLTSDKHVHVDWLTVGSTGALTLAPGTALHFASTEAFQVNGTLTALGTASEPITLTANSAAPSPGFWQGLYFGTGSVGELDHVTVEYGGAYDYSSPYNTGVEIRSNDVSLSNATIRHSEGIGLYSTNSMTLTGCVINDSSGYPVRIPASAIGDSQITANTFSGNGADALSVGGSTVTGDHSWPPWMSEYPVHIDWLTVGSGAALTLPAGISLHFPQGKALKVDGALTALGTASHPITMTANSAAPVPGYWQGLYFNSGSTGDLEYVTLQYAGDHDYTGSYFTGVEIHSSDVTLSHVTIADCQGIGVLATTRTTLVESTVTQCSGDGVRAGGIITMSGTLVSDSGGYPLRISASIVGPSVFTGTTFTGNNPDAILVIGAELLGSHTWPALFGQYPVHIDWLAVGLGGDLTLPAGAALHFAATEAFEVDGSLTARGTVSRPITLTAHSGAPYPGFWQGLYFNTGSSGDLDHVTVEYVGAYDFLAPYNTGVEVRSSGVSLSNATIRNCEGTGVHAFGDIILPGSVITGCTGVGVFAGGAISLTNSIVSNNGSYPLHISAASIGASEFTGSSFTDNTPNAILVEGATLMGANVWSPWLTSYPLHLDWLTVGSGATLSLPPGLALYFGSAGSIEVDGTLTALGAAGQPITMTARSAAPVPGFWEGLYFNGGSTGNLDYVTVEYAGSYDFNAPYNTSLEIRSGDVSLSHATVRHCEGTGVHAFGNFGLASSTVSNCTGYGVYAGGTITLTDSLLSENGAYPLFISAPSIGGSDFTGSALTGNTPNAVLVAGATLQGSHSWSPWLAQYPVHINWLTVGSGGALTLPAGLALHFASGGAFEVNGALTAIGEPSKPITMTARSSLPAPGFWEGLYFNDGSSVDVAYVTVEYAGKYDYNAPYNTSLEIRSDDVSLSHATVRHCEGTGVHAIGSVGLESILVSGCTGYGVYAGASITLTNGLLSGNGDYPLFISAASIGASEFTGSTLTGNSPDAVLVAGATLSGSHTWSPWLAQYPVHIDWLTVGSDGALSLPAGIGLHFDSAGAFQVNGTLVATGTVSAPVLMTAKSDAPDAGFWQGLYLNTGSVVDLDHVTVEYAGAYDYVSPYNTGVEVGSIDVSLSHATIRYVEGTCVHATSGATLDSSLVTGCSGYGLYAGGPITLTNTVASDNGSYPLRISAQSIGASDFTGFTMSGNTPDALRVDGATLSGTHFWPAIFSEYPTHIDWLAVGSDGALTLPAGAALHFFENNAFSVAGTLTALGTTSHPITLTAKSAAPSPGFWQGLYFGAGSEGNLDHLVVEYAGAYDFSGSFNTGLEIHSSDVSLPHTKVLECEGIGIFAASDVTLDHAQVTGCSNYGVAASRSITLTNSLISNNGSYPLRLAAQYVRSSTFAGSTFSGNSPNAILVTGGELAGTHAWPPSLAEHPVHINWLTIRNEASLTLPAGTALHFGQHEAFQVDGALLALGTPTMPITMTINSGAPIAGSWQGLYFSSGSSGVLEHVTVEYAGDLDYTQQPNQTGIELHSPNVSISNVTVQHNKGSGMYVTADTVLDGMLIQNNNPEGIRVADATVTIASSVIKDNVKGAYAANADLTIVNSHVVGNDVYGVQNGTSAPLVMATYNWWGDPTGPYHPSTNPGGLGDQVSDYVIYEPWRKLDTRPLDLGIIKTAQPEPVMVHANLTYTLVISNSGPDAAPSVVMTDSLPANVTHVSTTPSRGFCNGIAPIVCTWDSIAVGESVTVTIVVIADQPGLITNEVAVSTPAPDTHHGNNDASVSTLVVRNPAYYYTFLPLVLRR